MTRIYVASSWRNRYQPWLVGILRGAGHEVYDFRNPPDRAGFQWAEIDKHWREWSPEQYREALDHPDAQAGFRADKAGMDWAEICVLALPSGRSAHLEAGYMAGQGKRVLVFQPEPEEPELMNLLLDGITLTEYELLGAIALDSSDPPEDGA